MRSPLFKRARQGFLLTLALCLAAGVFALDSARAMSSATYQIWADVIGVGGSEGASSASFGVRDTAGEGVALSATSTSASYGIRAGFREMVRDRVLTFSVGSSAVSLGELSTTAVRTASHTMTVVTNADNGFGLTVSGSTLQRGSGADSITAIGATSAPSVTGSRQFGLNLAANTDPSIGAAVTGTSPRGAPAEQYAVANQFAFLSGDTVASASGPINSTVFTASYIANISSAVTAGSYSTTLTYTATANY